MNVGSDRVIDAIRASLQNGTSISIASASFSLFAYAELQKQLEALKACKLILPLADKGAPLKLLGSDGDRPVQSDNYDGRWATIMMAAGRQL